MFTNVHPILSGAIILMLLSLALALMLPDGTDTLGWFASFYATGTVALYASVLLKLE